MENYTKIYINGHKNVISRNTMKSILEILPKNLFCRVHKSFIVNREYVVQFNKNNITVIKDEKETKIPVGRVYCDDFFNFGKTESFRKDI